MMSTAMQIQRTVRRERYFDGTPTPGGARFDIGRGEGSILDQYLETKYIAASW